MLTSKKLRWVLFAAITLAVLLYLVGSYYIVFISTTSPSRELEKVTPATVGLTNYEDIIFQTAANDGLKLRGWWIPRKNSKRTLILLHVKNGNRTFALNISKSLWDKDFNILMFDLRGHGKSDGEHYSYGQYEQQDVVGAVAFLKDKGFQSDSIGIIGWSLGAAITLMSLSQLPEIKAGVSDSSYGDLSRVVQQRLGILNFFYPGIVLTSHFFFDLDIDQVKPEISLKRLNNQHVFLIHGDQDVTVPVSEFYHLKQEGGTSVTDEWVLQGVGHAGAYQNQPTEYLRRVVAFFNRELAP